MTLFYLLKYSTSILDSPTPLDLPFSNPHLRRFCFCLWLQNQTRTTLFGRPSSVAIWDIRSLDGCDWTAKYASRALFSLSVIHVRFRRFGLPPFCAATPPGEKNPESCTCEVELAAPRASVLSNQICRSGRSAIMFVRERVRDSKRHIVDWDRLSTPGIIIPPSALPTSACVIPSFIRRCLKCSAKTSKSLSGGCSGGCGIDGELAELQRGIISWLLSHWNWCWKWGLFSPIHSVYTPG